MSIATTDRKAGPFLGDGATTEFPFEFKVFDKAHLKVILTSSAGVESELVLDTHYTVSLNADQDDDPGGSVTLSAAPASGEKLTIITDQPATQEAVLANMGGFFPKTIEKRLDWLTILVQQLEEKLGRALIAAPSDSAPVLGIGTAAVRKHKYVSFDAHGNVQLAAALPAAVSSSVLDVREFGAVGDGVADDTAAVQAALDAVPEFGCVIIPTGYKFKISATRPGRSGYSIGLETKRACTVTGGGRLVCDNGGSVDQLVMLLVAHDGVIVEGVDFENTYTGGTRRSFAIAIGDRTDSNVPLSYGNIVIRKNRFFNHFYAIDCTNEAGTAAVVDGVRIEHNYVEGPSDLMTASGAINFISRDDIHRIRNIQVIGNRVLNASNSGGINIRGVYKFEVANNLISNCPFAGIETENGAKHGAITGNVLWDCGRGIWADDSADLGIRANTVHVKAMTLWGGGSTVREGIYLTREGFDTYTTWDSTNIQVVGNTVINGRIRSSTFGDGGGGQFGDLEVSHNTVVFPDSGDMQDQAISMISARSKKLVGNTTIGGNTRSILLSTATGETVELIGNTTKKAGAEASTGLEVAGGTPELIRIGNNWTNGLSGVIGTVVELGDRVAGQGRRLLFSGIQILAGAGSPEGVVTAPVGCLYLRTDGGPGTTLWVKENGTGNTGWAAK